jgi:hypothetical protein
MSYSCWASLFPPSLVGFVGLAPIHPERGLWDLQRDRRDFFFFFAPTKRRFSSLARQTAPFRLSSSLAEYSRAATCLLRQFVYSILFGGMLPCKISSSFELSVRLPAFNPLIFIVTATRFHRTESYPFSIGDSFSTPVNIP